MLNESKERYVLDAYAIIAYLGDEFGAENIENLLLKAKNGEIELFATWVSICEVYYQVQHRSSLQTAQTVVAALKSWPIRIISAGEKESMAAGNLKARYKISLGDSYVLGTAKVHGAIVVTGDPEFKALEEADEIRISWLPQERLK